MAVFIHLRPKPHLIQRAVQLHVVLGALDQHDVAVSRTADALVANRFARNLDQTDAKDRDRELPQRDEGSSAGGTQWPEPRKKIKGRDR